MPIIPSGSARGSGILRLTLALTAIIGVALGSAPAWSLSRNLEGSGGVVVLDASKVYLGNPKKAKNVKKPAVLKIRKVYAVIPAYQRIIDEDLTKSDARYHLLMAEATRTFRKALKKVAVERGHDFVAESGAITSGSPLPDLTKIVIKKIKGKP
jgi:hypothetical protein